MLFQAPEPNPVQHPPALKRAPAPVKQFTETNTKKKLPVFGEASFSYGFLLFCLCFIDSMENHSARETVHTSI